MICFYKRGGWEGLYVLHCTVLYASSLGVPFKCRCPLVLKLAGAAISIICVATKQTRICCDKHVFVAKKHVFCRDKSMLVTSRQNYGCRHNSHHKTLFLSRQKYTCRDKGFVPTNMILWRQTFSSAKHTFVATKDVFCRDLILWVDGTYVLWEEAMK